MAMATRSPGFTPAPIRWWAKAMAARAKASKLIRSAPLTMKVRSPKAQAARNISTSDLGPFFQARTVSPSRTQGSISNMAPGAVSSACDCARLTAGHATADPASAWVERSAAWVMVVSAAIAWAALQRRQPRCALPKPFWRGRQRESIASSTIFDPGAASWKSQGGVYTVAGQGQAGIRSIRIRRGAPRRRPPGASAPGPEHHDRSHGGPDLPLRAQARGDP